MALKFTLAQIQPVYIGLVIKPQGVYCALNTGGRITVRKFRLIKTEAAHKQIGEWLSHYATKQHIKIIAAGIIDDTSPHVLISELWLKNDIVPYHINRHGLKSREEAQMAALEVRTRFDANHLPVVSVNSRREVYTVSLASYSDYKKTVSKKHFERLIDFAERFKKNNGVLLFISSTPRGGGVALMRHALMRLMRLLSVNAHWHVLTNSEKEVFEITKKKFHNILQGVSTRDVELTKKDIKTYELWIKKNAGKLSATIRKASVIVVDDPQPSGLIPHIRRIHPSAKIIYRSHIHIESALTKKVDAPQYKTWQFIWNNVRSANVFISHPINAFIPSTVPKKKIALMPATTDPLDGLNKKLVPGQTRYYMQLFNKILTENGQTGLDRRRPYIIQIARFDPSKGILDVIESYRSLRVRLKKEKRHMKSTPQLVIAGHGAVDDPEGTPILTEVIHLLSMYRYRSYAHDIKVARLPHSDQILNALLRESMVALQLSYKEGFEVKVTEALAKGIPVIAYRTGGIPLQIEHGVTGYLVETGDSNHVAEYLYRLTTDRKRYETISKNALHRLKADFFTIANATRWLFLANELLQHGRFFGESKAVDSWYRKHK